MKLYDLFVMAKDNLIRRKLRTALTSIGIVIGTLSILLIISLGIGVKDSVNKKFSKSGSGNTIEMRIKNKKNNTTRLSEEIKTEKLLDLDLEFIRKMDGIVDVIPMINVPAKIVSGKY